LWYRHRRQRHTWRTTRPGRSTSSLHVQGNNEWQTLPRCDEHLLVFVDEQNSVGTSTVMPVAFRRLSRDAMWGHYVKTWRHPQKRLHTACRNATNEGPSYGNMHTNWRSSAVWFSSCANGQTDRQTDTLITILHCSQLSRGHCYHYSLGVRMVQNNINYNTAKLHQIFSMLPVAVVRPSSDGRCDMLCTSGFLGYVTFSHNGHYRESSVRS